MVQFYGYDDVIFWLYLRSLASGNGKGIAKDRAY